VIAAVNVLSHHPQPRFAGRHPAAARHRLLAVRHRAHALRLPAILINTHTALREVDSDVSRSGLGRHDSSPAMRRIRVPLALP